MESVIELPAKASRRQSLQNRHVAEPLDELNPRIRLKLCLQLNQDVCTEYTEAESEYTIYFSCISFPSSHYLLQAGYTRHLCEI